MADDVTRADETDRRAEPEGKDFVALYHRAFTEFGSRALWNIRRLDAPTPAEALAITRQLRTEGNMAARRLAEEIEQAARAHLWAELWRRPDAPLTQLSESRQWTADVMGQLLPNAYAQRVHCTKWPRLYSRACPTH